MYFFKLSIALFIKRILKFRNNIIWHKFLEFVFYFKVFFVLFFHCFILIPCFNWREFPEKSVVFHLNLFFLVIRKKLPWDTGRHEVGFQIAVDIPFCIFQPGKHLLICIVNFLEGGVLSLLLTFVIKTPKIIGYFIMEIELQIIGFSIQYPGLVRDSYSD